MKQFEELRLLAAVFVFVIVVGGEVLLLRCFIEIVPLNAGVLTTKKEHSIGRVYNGEDVAYIMT